MTNKVFVWSIVVFDNRLCRLNPLHFCTVDIGATHSSGWAGGGSARSAPINIFEANQRTTDGLGVRKANRGVGDRYSGNRAMSISMNMVSN